MLSLQKRVYAYQYMDDWLKINEMSLPEKEGFYSCQIDITDANYMHTKRVCKDFKIIHLGEYHDFHYFRISLFVCSK